MSHTEQNKKKVNNSITIGILAHVDAGKTTLSEAVLYKGGAIRKMGRVDYKNAFLDTSALERERGITIYSSQAQLEWKDLEITLLDTPGHVDFSSEMERTLPVLDYAVLVISGTDGVQGHTETLWSYLEQYQIPVFLFVNKMDLPGTEQRRVMENIRARLSERCVDFTDVGSEEFLENVAMCDEKLLETYVEAGTLLLPEDIRMPVARREVFPCFFGSALKMQGIGELLDALADLSQPAHYGSEFGARVYKITRDAQGNRLTHMKITGGELRIKMTVKGEEKVNQIRLYSGERYDFAESVCAGTVCAVTGPVSTVPGEGLGAEEGKTHFSSEPVLSYSVIFPEGTDLTKAVRQMKQLEEEDPSLHVQWDEASGRILVQPMGEVQLQILKSVIGERFGLAVSFDEGSIRYKETIRDSVEGVGHFEPLRHYAEVHLWMEPLPSGSGLEFAAECSEDKLDINWQRLVLTHLAEREFPGVLTGSPLTDMRITLAAGRAHLKHTEGGDFRQATYRAVRQGLMQAESVLLEPFYNFRIEVPQEQVGRVMADIRRMSGSFDIQPEREGMSVLVGSCPVATMKEYSVELASFTGGRGHISCTFDGYKPCHNAQEVAAQIGYDCERDVENTADSVFCSHGSGVIVRWDEVKEHMHVESVEGRFSKMQTDGETALSETTAGGAKKQTQTVRSKDFHAEDKELEAIFERTFGPVKRRSEPVEKRVVNGTAQVERVKIKKKEPVEQYLLVDGYNIIFSWEELKELSQVSLDAARMRLMEILCNYQGFTSEKLILVFDAYKVKGNPGSVENYHNISVVYTKEAETADMYIEKVTKKIAKRHRVRVATSDGMEQMIILGHGANRLSARAFREEVEYVNRQIREEYTQE